MKRLFVDSSLGKDFVLCKDEHHHLANVARCRVGENVVLVKGDEFDYVYKIEDIKRDATKLSFVSKNLNTKNPKKRLVVFLGAIKNMAQAVEQLSQIGIAEIIPFTSKNANAALNVPRLQKIAEQSCKQCGRSIPLVISEPLKFDKMCDVLTNFDNDSFALVIGPEGGLNQTEAEHLAQITNPISIGKRIMRTETAAVVAATWALSQMGEL